MTTPPHTPRPPDRVGHVANLEKGLYASDSGSGSARARTLPTCRQRACALGLALVPVLVIGGFCALVLYFLFQSCDYTAAHAAACDAMQVVTGIVLLAGLPGSALLAYLAYANRMDTLTEEGVDVDNVK